MKLTELTIGQAIEVQIVPGGAWVPNIVIAVTARRVTFASNPNGLRFTIAAKYVRPAGQAQ